jgi:hypothetical protein
MMRAFRDNDKPEVPYAKWFTPFQASHEPRKLSDDDLGLLFRAADYAFEGFKDRQYLDDMSRDLSAMSDRHIALRARRSASISSVINPSDMSSSREACRATLHERK